MVLWMLTETAWQKGLNTHINIASISVLWAIIIYPYVSWGNVDGFRPMSACIVVCIIGRKYEFREPESFIIEATYAFPLLQRETLFLCFNAVFYTHISENRVQKKCQSVLLQDT